MMHLEKEFKALFEKE